MPKSSKNLYNANMFHHAYLTDEEIHLAVLRDQARLSARDREAITEQAIDLIETCRKEAGHGELFDAFLQEYGLSTEEGVTLMRLAEALIRTPDNSTAYLLLRDKLSGRDWKSHQGNSTSNLVNLSSGGMALSASWIKKSGGHAAAGLLAKFGDSVLHKGVTAAMGVMSGHFVLGRDIEHAIKKSKSFETSGFSFSYDMLGEAAHTLKDAERYRLNYQHAINTIAKTAKKYESLEAAPGISVKLSALHPRYELAQRDICVPALITSVKKMALTAKAANIGLTIDAEEADRLEVSLLIAKSLIEDNDLKGWEGLTIVVQAYQRRAMLTIETLLGYAKASHRKFAIRLVKGAYWDMEIKRAQEMGLTSYPVFTRKENTDVSYLACARLLLDNIEIVYPQFATHNAATASAILHMAGNKHAFEFQRLHGMGEVLHRELMKRTGIRSRIYAPVGAYKDLLPYLVRRLLENGANSSFVNQFLDQDVKPSDMARDPIEHSLSNNFAAHPAIPEPRNMFDGVRLSAKGIDTTQLTTANALETLRENTKPISAKSILNGVEYIGGKTNIRNPADLEEIVGEAHAVSKESLEGLIDPEKPSKWRTEFSPQKRSLCLLKTADALETNMNLLLSLCVREAGKTWIDAIAEVREAVDFCRYYANQALQPEFEHREGLGVVLCISPWNFPLAIFLGQVTASLAAGNVVICKPAEQTPLIAYIAVKFLHESGVPADALHLTIGSGSEIGAALVASKHVNGVCFTGSTATAKRITKTLAETNRPLTPLIAETGGLNAMIVDSTALLEQAVSDVIASGYQSAGQRCSACRIVCLQDEIADDFIEMLSGSIDVLKVGNPAELSTDVGPVINLDALEMLTKYTEESRKRWKVIGEYTQKLDHLDGFYFKPIAFELPSVSKIDDEKFGPILHIVRYKSEDLDKLVNEINALGYGLTMGLHTRIDSRVERVTALAEVGNLYVNRNQIGAVVGVQPFGGEGLSGTGPKAGGPLYMKRLSRCADPRVTHQLAQTSEILRINEHPNTELPSIIKRSIDALSIWETKDRVAILTRCADNLDQLMTAKGLQLRKGIRAGTQLMEAVNLPGPTGEKNILTFHPRGVLAVLAGTDVNILTRQVSRVISTGNSAIIIATHPTELEMSILSEALVRAGAPRDLVSFVPASDGFDLLRGDIHGVVVDGPDRNKVGRLICERGGAILPILSINDDIERFFIERTRTVDTTAAGGNASLLAM